MRQIILNLLAFLSIVSLIVFGITVAFDLIVLPSVLQAYSEYALIALISLAIFFTIFAALNKRSNSFGGNRASYGKSKKHVPTGRSYRKQYLEHLYYRHRDFDVKGLSTQGIFNLEQEDIFVRLKVEPQSPDQIDTGLVAKIPIINPDQNEHTIWDYMKSIHMGHHFAIIGAPGSGKTTLLKHITLIFSNSRNRRFIPRTRIRTPILLFLRDNIEHIRKQPDIKLTDLVQNYLSSWDLAPPENWFEKELLNNRCVVMLDGLDEVAESLLRQQVVKWVETQIKLYPKNWFIITSRPGGYRSNPLTGVHVLGVCPFTGNQVREFVVNWYKAIEVMSSKQDDPGIQMKAKEGAEDLLRRLANAPALTELARTPLLLTMIATIHRYRSTLPGKRVELYTEICEVSLGKRRQAHNLDIDMAPLQKQRVLEPLAFHMMEAQEQIITAEDALNWVKEPLLLMNPKMSGLEFLKKIEESSGLLQERENGVYSFAHKTFQEYLAAIHVERNQLEYILTDRVEDIWWHETIRLYAARTDASAIIEACIRGNHQSVRALALARECLKEAAAVRPALRELMENFFRQDAEDIDELRRKNAAEALLTNRLMLRMARVDDNRWIDTTLLKNAEYQLFINEMREKGKNHQPDHWPGFQFPNGMGDKPVLGVRATDALAFCDWLTKREGDWRYSLPKPAERDLFFEDKIVNAGYWSSDTQGGKRFEEYFDVEEFRTIFMHRIERDFANLQIMLLFSAFNDVLRRVRDLLSNANYDRDLPLYRTQALKFTRDLEIAQALAQSCISARDLGLSRLFQTFYELASATTQDLVQSHELAQASERAKQPDQRLSKANASDKAYTNALSNLLLLNNSLNSSKDRIGSLMHILSDDLIKKERLLAEILRDLDFSNVTIIILAQALISAHNNSKDLLHDSMRLYIFTPDFEKLRIFCENNAFALDYRRTLICEQAFDRSPDALWRKMAASDPDRTYLRIWSLINGIVLNHAAKEQLSDEQQRWYREINKQKYAIDICHGIYIDLVLFEERIARNLPPVEGIRLVKEPRIGS